MRFVYAILLSGVLLAQDQPIRIDAATKRPEPVQVPSPEYSDEARNARIEGIVLLSVVIGADGKVRDVEVISPLGLGLDERAIEAVGRWRFRPAELDGRPVAVIARVQVEFKFRDRPSDRRPERYRTEFNEAIVALAKDSPDASKAKETVRRLASKQYPPAMATLGTWMLYGLRQQPEDRPEGLRLLEAAAQKNSAPALYELGRWKASEGDITGAVRLFRQASDLGSMAAQSHLARLYESGDSGVARDLKESRRQFRLCAVNGDMQCQLALALQLLESVRENERIEGLAWLSLTVDRGNAAATEQVRVAAGKLTPEQLSDLGKLKEQLAQRIRKR